MELTACRAIGAGVSIAPYAFETPIDTYSNPKKASDAAERLKRFLGAEKEETLHLSLDQADKRFCKDCVNLIQHPFVLRCSLDGRAVNPMDDCDRFQAR